MKSLQKYKFIKENNFECIFSTINEALNYIQTKSSVNKSELVKENVSENENNDIYFISEVSRF